MRYPAIAILALALLMPTELAAADSYSVQAATFSNEVRALRTAKALRGKGLDCDYVKRDGLYKVFCGRFASMKDAAPMRELVRDAGYADAFYILTPAIGVIESTPAKPSALKSKTMEPQTIMPHETKPDAKLRQDVAPAAPPSTLTPKPAVPVIKPMEAGAPSVDARKPGEKSTSTAPKPAPKEQPASQEIVQPRPEPTRKEEESIERITADILGRSGNRLHPFASESVIRNTNVYFTEDNELSDTVTLSTLGLWAALPGMRSNVLEETTSSITPGGWELPGFYNPGDRLYQVYALYRMDAENYATHSDLDFTGHKAQAHAEFNLRSGHSVILDDIYLISRDGKDVGLINATNKYRSNLSRLTFVARPSPKTSIELEARTFSLAYDETVNGYKNRSDSTLRTSIDYRPLGRTSFGLEYARTELDYESTDRSDMTDADVFGRVKWEITGKSVGLIKAGYSNRTFEGASEDSDSRLKVLGQLNYNFSPKTTFELKSWKYRNETDYSTADFVDVNKYIATLNWKLTGKTTLTIEDEYQTNKYIDTNPSAGGSGAPRTDEFNDILFSLQTRMRDWITIELGYEYQTRSSTLDGSSYDADFLYTSLSVAF